MDRARMNSAIRVFNDAVLTDATGGMVSEKVSNLANIITCVGALVGCVCIKRPAAS